MKSSLTTFSAELTNIEPYSATRTCANQTRAGTLFVVIICSLHISSASIGCWFVFKPPSCFIRRTYYRNPNPNPNGYGTLYSALLHPCLYSALLHPRNTRYLSSSTPAVPQDELSALGEVQTKRPLYITLSLISAWNLKRHLTMPVLLLVTDNLQPTNRKTRWRHEWALQMAHAKM